MCSLLSLCFPRFYGQTVKSAFSTIENACSAIRTMPVGFSGILLRCNCISIEKFLDIFSHFSMWFWFQPRSLPGLILKMKIVYTILFFADTLLLIVLSFLFLKMIDNSVHGWPITLLASAIIGSILLLIFFLLHYLKLPSSDKHKHF